LVPGTVSLVVQSPLGGRSFGRYSLAGIGSEVTNADGKNMAAGRLAIVISGVAVVGASVLAPVVVARAATTTDVTTAAYDNLRDNWDHHEPGLTPSVVQSSSFGQEFSTPVSGSVYAQPLVVNGTVIVTTEQAMAYGINATTGAVQWSRSFGSPFEAATNGCTDLTPDLGSTSTPVVDPATGTVYLTTRLETGSGGLANAHWYLQAVSETTGQEAPGFPVEITGTPYNTPGVPFNDPSEEQRPALLLLNGVVYLAFASDCDFWPYRGIVVGVSTTTHAITSMWSDESGVGTDENSQAGIWQSGAGLVSDEPNHIILTTGNGISPNPAASNAPPRTLSESVVGLNVGASGKIKPIQFFSPSNAANLDANDEDLGSGGPVALSPAHFGTSAHPHLLVEEGKDGRVLLIDSDNMGGFKQAGGALQKLGPFEGEWGHPAVYGGQGGWVYIMQNGGGPLRVFSYGLSGQGLPQLASAGTSAEFFGFSSSSPLVTSKGTTAGSAVVWAVDSNGGSGQNATLMAYGAIPTHGVLPLLWSAPIGTASKYVSPTASNGRVYVGTRDGHLLAFGAGANAPLQAAAVKFGSVPVGSSRTTTLVATTPQGLTVTGPATVSGYQGVTGPTATGSSGTVTPSTVVSGSATTIPVGATAGPKVPPPPVAKPIAGSVFAVGQPPAGTTFAPGATVRLPITFTPDGPGPVVAALSIPTSAGTQTVSISGYGTAPGLLLSAKPLDFDTVNTGAGGKALTVSLTNSWNQSETVTGLNLPHGPYSVTGLPPVGTVLAPQQSVTASVNFDPGAAGSYPSALSVSTNHGSVTVPVSGSAVTGVEQLAVTSASVDAGSVPIGRTVRVTFGVGNSGTVALIVTRAIAPSGAFSSPVPVPEGTIIEPGTFLNQTVTFHPTALGPTSSHYIFNSNDGRGPVTVTLHGTGT
jgi:PQQ-like domain